MPDTRQSLGAWGEQIALRFLLDKGDRLLGRNVRTAFGELDLITERRSTIVFTEVKTRRSDAFGMPEESITAAKHTHLLRSAQAYLGDHPELDSAWQIDVIAIRKQAGLRPQIVHFENALPG